MLAPAPISGVPTGYPPLAAAVEEAGSAAHPPQPSAPGAASPSTPSPAAAPAPTPPMAPGAS
eukprot:10022980-Alexandrium_andersonii.AAC.1